MKLLPLLAYSKKRPTMIRRMKALEDTLNAMGAVIEFEAEEENTPVQDNIEDQDAINYVIEQYNSGNQYAWFTAKVSVKYRGIEGADYLGCCSYKSEEDFKTDGYFHDMVNTCIEEVNKEVKAHNADIQKRWNIRKAKNLVQPYGIILVETGKELHHTI